MTTNLMQQNNSNANDEFLDNSRDVPIATAPDVDPEVDRSYKKEEEEVVNDIEKVSSSSSSSEQLVGKPGEDDNNNINDKSDNGLGSPTDIDDNDAPPLYTYIQSKLSGYGWMITGIIILAYSIWAFIADFQRALPLLIVECIIITIVLFHWVTDKYYAECKSNVQNQVIHFCMETMEKSKIAAVLCIILIVVLVGVLIEDAKNLISLLGLIVFILMSWATSYKPKQVKWRPVLSGVVIQFILGVLILRVVVIANAFKWLGDQITIFLNYTSAGSMFVYGYLADSALGSTPVMLANGEEYTLYPPFYFSVLSVLFFFSAFVSICHYLGIIGWLVKRLGVGLALVMGTSPVETFNCIANMFLDLSQSPMLLKPALVDVTDSELHAIMTAGFASTAGAVLAAYISFGVSASDLLAATVMVRLISFYIHVIQCITSGY